MYKTKKQSLKESGYSECLRLKKNGLSSQVESVLANHVSLVNVYQSLVLFALRFFLNLSLIHFCERVLLIFPTYEIGRFSRLVANPQK